MPRQVSVAVEDESHARIRASGAIGRSNGGCARLRKRRARKGPRRAESGRDDNGTTASLDRKKQAEAGLPDALERMRRRRRARRKGAAAQRGWVLA